MPTYESMLRRQKVLADFGDFALRSDNLVEVLTEACRLVSEALGTGMAKVLEVDGEAERLQVKAGVGWRPGVVGQAVLPMGARSPETYALRRAEPVITRNLEEERRFDFPDFMREHGVAALVSVPLFLPGGRPYGLIQVGSREPREFGAEDVEFLRTYAAILGSVIDRLHKVQTLDLTMAANEHLLTELQHRVKNHFGIIMSMVHLRGREARSDEARAELASIGKRIETLRLVHEQLYIGGLSDRLQLRSYVTQLLENLCGTRTGPAGNVRLDLAISDVDLPADLAVPLGLILNEFVTNSLKYAFDESGGTIAVVVEPLVSGLVRVRMSDDGRGLPAPPATAARGSSTGMRIMTGLARQIGAEPVWTVDGGTALCLEFPATQR